MVGRHKLGITAYMFLILLFLPLAQQLFGIFNIRPVEELRRKNAFPEINVKSLISGDFMKKFDLYYNDTFGFRDLLIRLNNNISYHLFKTSDNQQVIIGKNGWFYYSETLNDYRHIPTITPGQAKQIVEKLAEFQQALQDNNINFVFFIAPNKNTIYPEHMPENIPVELKASNYQILRQAIKNDGRVNYLEFTEDLKRGRDNNIIYRKRDTHWNEESAVIVANKLLRYMSDKNKVKIQPPRIIGHETVKEGGDLNGMLAIDELVEFRKPLIKNFGKKNLGNVLWLHDSFGQALLPVLEPYFQNNLKVWHFRDPMVSQDNFSNLNFVIFEIVERNIPTLLNYNIPAVYNINVLKNSRVIYRSDFKNRLDWIPLNQSRLEVLNDNLVVHSEGDDPSFENADYIDLGSPEKNCLIQITLSTKVRDEIKFYFKSKNGDYSELISEKADIEPGINKYLLKVPQGLNLFKIRIDPLTKPGRVTIKEIVLIEKLNNQQN